MKNEHFFRIHWDHFIVLIGLFFCCFAVGLCAFPSVNVQADEEIPINETNFPDQIVSVDDSSVFPSDYFRSVIAKNVDLDNDGMLSTYEILAVKSLTVGSYSQNVNSLKGIELFTNLTELDCQYCEMYDLSEITNSKLEKLICYRSNIRNLDTGIFPELKYLDCSGCTNLESIDVSGNAILEYLNCGAYLDGWDENITIFRNKLSGINVSNNTALETLITDYNNFSNLNVSNNIALKTLSCRGNKLTSLDLSNNTELTEVDCSNNQLANLTVSNCRLLETLKCDHNKLDVLELTNNAKLTRITCSYNSFTTLDITPCKALSYIDCYSCPQLQLNAKDCTKLQRVKADHLTSLDVSGCTKLTDIGEGTYEYGSEITITVDNLLNAENCCSLERLNGSFPHVNLHGCTKLWSLKFYNCQIDSLDIQENTALREIYVSNTHLQSLDIRYNTLLTTLNCSNNILSDLNVKNNVLLTELDCSNNKLSKLDISNNTKLARLSCYNNQIEQLNISNIRNLLQTYYLGTETDLETKMIYRYSPTGGNGYLLYYDKTTCLITEEISPKPTIPTEVSITPTSKPAVTSKPTTNPNVSITINKSSLLIVCGRTDGLKATVKGSSSGVVWKSSDAKIVAVDKKGNITAKMAGTAAVTATVAGKSDVCKVTVLYKDVTNVADFWYAPTNYLTANGVVKGYANQTEFRPANDCTRAQMVTFLYRLQGEPKPKSSACKFGDVKNSDYFFKPVLWAVENGITTGVSKTEFNPQGVCTRAQTVTFLWRMANKPEPKTTKNPFPDVKKTDYFYKATLWASETKILAGLPDGTFNPQGKCLRRQMVTFLYKYDKHVNGKG